MTYIKPAYAVTAQPSGADLGDPSGTVSLDVARWPHVEGDIRVKAAPGLFDMLDPRNGARRIVLSCEDEISGGSRVFDLGVRSVTATPDNMLALRLASDEAIIEDYTPVDDVTITRDLERSGRDISAAVLNTAAGNLHREAIPLAGPTTWTVFEESPSATTMIVEPVTGASTAWACRVTSPLAVFGIRSERITAVEPGETYTARGEIRPALDYTVSLRIQWLTSLGALISESVIADAPGADTWAQLVVTATAPAGTDSARLVARVDDATGLADTIHVTNVTLVPGPTPAPALEPGETDFPFHTFWQVQNLFTNPRYQSNVKGTATSSGGTSFASVTYDGARALRWTSAASSSIYVAGWDPTVNAMRGIPVTPGETYTVTLEVATQAGGMVGVTLGFRGELGGFSNSVSDQTAYVGTTYEVRTVTATAAAGAAYLYVQVDLSGVAAGSFGYATEVTITNTDRNVGIFHGGHAPDLHYTYQWDGAPDDSTSSRIPVVTREPAALIWPAGRGGMSFLATLLQAGGLRLVCDEQRRWTLRDNTYAEINHLSLAFGDNLHDYDLTASMDDGWCDAATILYKSQLGSVERIITETYESVPHPRKRRRIEIESAYPGPGRAQHIVERARRSTTATATALNNWSTKPEQSIDLTTSVNGHIDTTYTPWVEQRRNLFDDPAPASIAAPASGMTRWFRNSGSSAQVALDPDGWVRIYADIALTDATAARAANWAGNSKTVSAETTYTLSFDQEKAAGLGDLRLAWWAYTAAGVGIGGERIVLPQVADSGRVYYTFTTPTNAERIAFVVRRNPQSAWVAGDWYRIRRTRLALGMDATYFDGATDPSGLLERTRWLGTPNASASVIETRQVESSTWVNDPEVVLVGTIGAVTFDLDTDQMTVAIRPDEETP